MGVCIHFTFNFYSRIQKDSIYRNVSLQSDPICFCKKWRVHSYVCIYIYTPRTQLSPIFKDQPSKTRAQTPIKPRGPIFLVPGVYLCTVLGTKISDPKALLKMMLMFLFPFGGNMVSFPQGDTPEIWRPDIPNMAFQIKLEELFHFAPFLVSYNFGSVYYSFLKMVGFPQTHGLFLLKNA